VINDERAIWLAEKLTKTDGSHRRVTTVQIARPFFKLIVLNGSALGEMSAQLSKAFALAHKLDFGEAKLLALA
jgi:hypothetical protein